MLDSVKIMDAINRELVRQYPDYTVYLDLCPSNFERPSFLIEFITLSQDTANLSTVNQTAYYTVTCYDVVDDYDHSDTTRLLRLQHGVMNLFRSGALDVDGRHIKVSASTGGRDWDRSYVDLQFSYYDDRSDAEDDTPLMERVYTNIKKED